LLVWDEVMGHLPPGSIFQFKGSRNVTQCCHYFLTICSLTGP
jgi:hypothetical protein